MNAACGEGRARLLAGLTRCLTACDDTGERYARAAHAVRSPLLRALFLGYAAQREAFAVDVETLLRACVGGDFRESSSHRQLALSTTNAPPDDESLILDDVMRADARARRTYDAVLVCTIHLPQAVSAVLTAHEEALGLAVSDFCAHILRERPRIGLP